MCVYCRVEHHVWCLLFNEIPGNFAKIGHLPRIMVGHSRLCKFNKLMEGFHVFHLTDEKVYCITVNIAVDP